MNSKQSFSTILIIAAIIVVLYSCKDIGTELPPQSGLPASGTVSFSNQIQPIFNSQCTSCHGGSGGLTITAGVSYNNLVNVNAQSSCTSLKRVLPNDADNSVLYKKVSGPTCGSQMPQGGALSTSDITLIRDWINQGANNN